MGRLAQESSVGVEASQSWGQGGLGSDCLGHVGGDLGAHHGSPCEGGEGGSISVRKQKFRKLGIYFTTNTIY